MNNVEIFDIWEEVEEEGIFCQGCEHCERTKDAYGTGDSPTMRECMAKDPQDCYGVMEEYNAKKVTE
jgi:hypothetical protein